MSTTVEVMIVRRDGVFAWTGWWYLMWFQSSYQFRTNHYQQLDLVHIFTLTTEQIACPWKVSQPRNTAIR